MIAIFDTLRTKAFGTITGLYTTIGAVLTHNWKAFKVTNYTDAPMLLSTDGTTDMVFLAPNSYTLYDLSANTPPVSVNDTFVFPKGLQFYIKYSTAPSIGSVYIEGLYAKGV